MRHVLSMNLTRTIIALIITLSILPLCATSFTMISNVKFSYDEINDELALVDLRRILLLSYDLDFNQNELNFIYQNKNYNLSIVNNRLVLSPGYQMFLNDVDYLSFFKKDGCIFITYERHGRTYERVLCSQEGIHLDEFSDCHDDNDSDSESQS